jgi:hypothetical protein
VNSPTVEELQRDIAECNDQIAFAQLEAKALEGEIAAREAQNATLRAEAQRIRWDNEYKSCLLKQLEVAEATGDYQLRKETIRQMADALWKPVNTAHTEPA